MNIMKFLLVNNWNKEGNLSEIYKLNLMNQEKKLKSFKRFFKKGIMDGPQINKIINKSQTKNLTKSWWAHLLKICYNGLNQFCNKKLINTSQVLKWTPVQSKATLLTSWGGRTLVPTLKKRNLI